MRQLNPARALVLFSGGQDSAISLAWALERYDHVETVGFDYGQRHAVELEARKALRVSYADRHERWANRLGEDTLVDLAGLGQISDTAMTRDIEIAMTEEGLPTTFVPGRNLVFLVMAGTIAYRRDLGVLIGGMCEADFSGYPDCRTDALAAQMTALRLGMDADLSFEAPLMSLTKAQSWQLAFDLDGERLVEIIRAQSHSCYLGARGTLHQWGYGCGTCPACELRANGWHEYARTAKQKSGAGA